MGRVWRNKKWMALGLVVLVLAIAAVIGSQWGREAGGNTKSQKTQPAYSGVAISSGAAQTSPGDASSSKSTTYGQASSASPGGAPNMPTLAQTNGQKVITNGSVELEIGAGNFEKAYDQALLIASRYGGSVVSSSSQAELQDGSIKSGTITIRIPSFSFNSALADASKLGKLKSRMVQTEDVTEEYVDLKARITNSKANVQSLRALLAEAKTVSEVLQVQQSLTSAQEELEQLEGRQQYLDENTTYSTLTLTMYETGAVVAVSSGWGVKKAFDDALHNLVGVFNALIRGLAVLIPVLLLVALVVYVVYRIWRGSSRRRAGREVPHE